MPPRKRVAQIIPLACAIVLIGCQAERPAEQDAQGSAVANDSQSSAKPISASGFAAMDANADGQLTESEHSSAAARMFDTMDADGDGIVTAVEMDSASNALGASKQLSSADKIKVVDENRDGRLSRQEHVDGSKAMYAKIDKDGSGSLSDAEFYAGHKAMLGS